MAKQPFVILGEGAVTGAVGSFPCLASLGDTEKYCV